MSSESKSRRMQRVERTLREVVGQTLSMYNHLFDGALITLVRIQVSPDLRNAKAFVSVFEGDDDEVLEVIEEIRPEIQRKIGKDIPMKFCPKLKFYIDPSIDKLVHISDIINKDKQTKVD